LTFGIITDLNNKYLSCIPAGAFYNAFNSYFNLVFNLSPKDKGSNYLKSCPKNDTIPSFSVVLHFFFDTCNPNFANSIYISEIISILDIYGL
jgi:hypothetical protein